MLRQPQGSAGLGNQLVLVLHLSLCSINNSYSELLSQCPSSLQEQRLGHDWDPALLQG